MRESEFKRGDVVCYKDINLYLSGKKFTVVDYGPKDCVVVRWPGGNTSLEWEPNLRLA